MKRCRVVIDINVFVSALHFNGLPEKILALVRTEEIELYTSPFILGGLETVLRINSSGLREMFEER